MEREIQEELLARLNKELLPHIPNCFRGDNRFEPYYDCKQGFRLAGIDEKAGRILLGAEPGSNRLQADAIEIVFLSSSDKDGLEIYCTSHVDLTQAINHLIVQTNTTEFQTRCVEVLGRQLVSALAAHDGPTTARVVDELSKDSLRTFKLLFAASCKTSHDRAVEELAAATR